MKKYIFILIVLVAALSSCENFMDIVPDNIPNIDNIFGDREQTEKYLYSCYSLLPQFGTDKEPGMTCGDQTWYTTDVNGYPQNGWALMRMGNNVSEPLYNYWASRYAGIRWCNNFLENIQKVPDMNSVEKSRWAAEVKVIKAFHYFYLLQMYGPVPIVRENLPIDATPEEVAIFRDPVDDVVDYIVELIDEAAPHLQPRIENLVSELGRITRPIALSIKAKALVTAASPLFSGNTAYAQLKDNRGVTLFNQDTSEETKRLKWERAATACKEAIDVCLQSGHRLYELNTTLTLSDVSTKVVQCAQIITDKWNVEHIWGQKLQDYGSGSTREIQMVTIPPLHTDHRIHAYTRFCPTLKMAELFYTKNGVPMDEDKEFDYEGRYTLQRLDADDTYHKYLLQPNRVTAKLHQNREYRFYGSLAVDGGWWFGIGRNNEDAQWPLNIKAGQVEGGRMGNDRYPICGFYVKKLASYLTTYSGWVMVQYGFDWPIFRLADLYLLYAEALNESLSAPNSEVYFYIDEVRKRAGLEGVAYSWENFSQTPDRYKSKTGMRGIIQQERSIELAFEGHRFWDLRRWGLAIEKLRQPVQGWNNEGETDIEFYTVVNYAYVNYSLKDILWPIPQEELSINRNLVQNPGW